MAAAKLGGKCVFASEIEAGLRQAYEENFGLKPAGDIWEIEPREVPRHNLLCAGFPCQPFSKAGEQKGWRDAIRGTVFFSIVEMLRHHKPEYLILENVAHFVRHDRGNTYAKVKQALESLGYEVQHTQLSPHQFGVPQIRGRMYMVGRLGGLGAFEWPEPVKHANELSIRSVLDKNPPDAQPLGEQVVQCMNVWQDFLQTFPEDGKLPSFPIWSMEFRATYPYDVDSLHDVPLKALRAYRGSFGQSLNLQTRCEVMKLVPSHARAERGCFPRWKQLFIRQNRDLYKEHQAWLKDWLPRIRTFPISLQKCEWNCQGEERDIWKYVIQFRASGVRIKRPTTSPSLVAMTTTQVPIIAWERRYMTVRECARLQSMDELKHFPKVNAAMAALGNAVNVTVVTKILEKLLTANMPNVARKRDARKTTSHPDDEASQLIVFATS